MRLKGSVTAALCLSPPLLNNISTLIIYHWFVWLLLNFSWCVIVKWHLPYHIAMAFMKCLYIIDFYCNLWVTSWVSICLCNLHTWRFFHMPAALSLNFFRCFWFWFYKIQLSHSIRCIHLNIVHRKVQLWLQSFLHRITYLTWVSSRALFFIISLHSFCNMIVFPYHRYLIHFL